MATTSMWTRPSKYGPRFSQVKSTFETAAAATPSLAMEVSVSDIASARCLRSTKRISSVLCLMQGYVVPVQREPLLICALTAGCNRHLSRMDN
jgi:hypothetical protein